MKGTAAATVSVVAVACWLATVAVPVGAAATVLVRAEPPAATHVAIRSPAVLLAGTAAHALVVAVGAVAAGWAPGCVLGRVLHGRGFVPLAASLLLPICLPAYVVFYTWWQSWPADSALYAWAVARQQIPLLRTATLVVALVCWSWPLVAWCVAGSAGQRSAGRSEMLRLDGASTFVRLLDRLRTDGRGLAVGGLLVFLTVFNNTTCFDLAQIFTFGNELRAIDADGGSPRQVLAASLPAVALATVGAIAVWVLLTGRPWRQAIRPASPRGRTWALAATVWLLSVLVPATLLADSLVTRIVDRGWGELEQFGTFYGRAVLNSVALAVVAGVSATVVALGLIGLWLDDRRWCRGVGHAMAAGWLLMALVPGTIVGVALEAAYNTPATAMMYRRPAILVAGYVARFAFVAALLARWFAVREPRVQAEMRRLDGAQTLSGVVRAGWPRLIAVIVSCLAIVTVLAMGEIPVTARVHPPGSDPLVVALLNAMHFQRPETVVMAVAGLAGLAVMASLATALVWAPRWRAGAVAGAMIMLAAGLGGCGLDEDASGAPLRTRFEFGRNGTSLGQFSYPRCIAVDADRGFVYVIDKTARVQRFGLDGEPHRSWSMPEKANGKPTGVSVAPDGRVFVADTHYHRVIAYDPEGRELMRFGSYGEGPGQFIYPTDVAVHPAGRLYVSEYGGHDRIQVFSSKGEYLFEFGSFGDAVGEYQRPQSLAFSADGSELFIADSCNHRVVVVDPDGRPLRVFGIPGDGDGQMHYPYGLTVRPDGTLLVSEFGNSRVQHFAPDGTSLGRRGRPGAGEGELRYPWGVDGTESLIYVLDSGNHRVVTTAAP